METVSKDEKKVIMSFITENTQDMESTRISEVCGIKFPRLNGILSKMVKNDYLKRTRVHGKEYVVYHLTEKGRVVALVRAEELV